MQSDSRKLRFTSQDGAEEEVIEFFFSGPEFKVLEAFRRNCDRLVGARIFKKNFPFVKNVTWTQTEGLSFEITEFDYGDVCELLHVARPIFLSKEPASFERTQAIFGKQGKGTAVLRQLKYLRYVYEHGDYQPYFQVSVGGVPLFDDETLKSWLNGVEYHQDSEKRKIVKKLEEALSENIIRGIFVAQLAGRIRATFMLGDMVNLVLGDEIT